MILASSRLIIIFNAILMAYHSVVEIEASQGNDAVFILLSVTTAEPTPKLFFEPSVCMTNHSLYSPFRSFLYSVLYTRGSVIFFLLFKRNVFISTFLVVHGGSLFGVLLKAGLINCVGMLYIC